VTVGIPIESAYHGAKKFFSSQPPTGFVCAPLLRWRFRPAVIIAMCDKVAEQHVPLFPGRSVFCQWNFPDPLATKADDAKQERAFEQVFRQILRRVSAFLVLPLHPGQAAE
jgi:hypothetical protein